MVEVIIDARLLTDKEDSHEYLKKQLDLPEYYGGNLDALYDCLTELDETEIVIIGEDEAGEYFHRVLSVIWDACEENGNLTLIQIVEE